MNDFSTCDEDSREAVVQLCCLRDGAVRCHRPAGNASYNKRIVKIVAQRKLRLTVDSEAQHVYICEFHKAAIQSARTRKRRRESLDETMEDDTSDPHPTSSHLPHDVDLHQLQVNALRRYKRYFKVPTRPGMNKAQLAEYLLKHFRTLAVVEKDVLTYFIYTVKTNRNRLHQRTSAILSENS